MNLRPYQQDCVSATEKAFGEFNKVLDVLPTGAGKTIVFSHLADRRRQRGERTLILAHREELIEQAIAKLQAATGIRAEKEKAEFHASLESPVVVASIQTMIRRLHKWPKDHFGLLVADEAHHALSDSWQSVLNHFDAQVLGVTATPHRGDCRNLGHYFETIGYEIKLVTRPDEEQPGLINQGYLSPIVIKSIPLEIDLNQVRTVAGDFKDADLGSALEPYLNQIAVAIRDHATFRRTLAFLPLIATSHKFVEACRNAGLTAEHVDGESPDRKEKLERFAKFDFEVLSNAMLLTEGFDDPGIDCVCVLRPTRSQPLFAQAVGRGTRIAPGKENLLLLDFLWLHARHSIIRPAHLIARDDFEAEQITKLTQNSAALPAELCAELPLDLQELAGVATKQREEALRKKLEEQKNKKAKVISAEQFAMSHNSLETAEYTEAMPWESAPVTEKQAKWLKRAHIDISTVRSKGHASRLLSLYFDKKPLTLASTSQQSLMRRMGHPNPDSATAEEARRFFANLRKPKQEEMAI